MPNDKAQQLLAVLHAAQHRSERAGAQSAFPGGSTSSLTLDDEEDSQLLVPRQKGKKKAVEVEEEVEIVDSEKPIKTPVQQVKRVVSPPESAESEAEAALLANGKKAPAPVKRNLDPSFKAAAGDNGNKKKGGDDEAQARKRKSLLANEEATAMPKAKSAAKRPATAAKAKAAPVRLLAAVPKHAARAPPKETESKAEGAAQVPVKIQRQDTSLSSTDAREILNRQSTSDVADEKGLPAIGRKSEEAMEEEKGTKKKRDRDPIAHARRNRFYRSLSSVNSPEEVHEMAKNARSGGSKNEKLAVLFENWCSSNENWKTSSLVMSMRETKTSRRRGARKWLLRAELLTKYNGDESIVDEIIAGKMADEATRKVCVRRHPDLLHQPDDTMENTQFLVFDEAMEADEDDVVLQSLFKCTDSGKESAKHKKNGHKKRSRSESSTSVDSDSESESESDESSSSSEKKKKDKKKKKKGRKDSKSKSNKKDGKKGKGKKLTKAEKEKKKSEEEEKKKEKDAKEQAKKDEKEKEDARKIAKKALAEVVQSVHQCSKQEGRLKKCLQVCKVLLAPSFKT